MGPFTTLLHGPAAAPTGTSRCGYVLSAPALFIGCHNADAPVTDEQRAFALAVLLYRVGRTLAAYALFTKLADGGHVRSARIALAMQDGGPVHASSDATAAQLLEWQHTAGRAPLAHQSVAG